jgi:hypothetical protein
VKRDLRGAVSRLGKDTRLAAAARYREALADKSSDVRLYLAAAAALDGLAGAKRAISAAPHSTSDVADSAVALGRRLRHRNSLLVEHASVGRAADLSLSLTGPEAVSGSVQGISLVPADGLGPATPVPTEVAISYESVRLVATLPESMFTGATRRWRLTVTADRAEVPVVVAARSVLDQRWGSSVHRPLRVELDADRQLTVVGQLDEPEGVEHAVSLGLTTAIVTWPGEVAELRWTARDSQVALVISGHRNGGGTCAATLDLLSLADRPSDTWDATVATSDDTWRPLALAPGEYPPLAGGPVVRLQRTDGRTVPVRVGYSRRNRLTVRVGAER